MSRDIIVEITQIRSRHTPSLGSPDTNWKRLEEITNLLETATGHSDEFLKNELYKHICVSSIALLQTHVRHTISSIVDHKESKGDSIPELKDIKLTLAIARELKNEKFTFGELIAHFLPTSSFEQISASLKHVSGEGFLSLIGPYIKEILTKVDFKYTFDEAMSLIKDSTEMLFVHRNVVCHEQGCDYHIPLEDVIRGLRGLNLVISGFSHFEESLHEDRTSASSQ